MGSVGGRQTVLGCTENHCLGHRIKKLHVGKETDEEKAERSVVYLRNQTSQRTMGEKSAGKNSARYRDTRVEIGRRYGNRHTQVRWKDPGYRPTYLEDCLLTQKLIWRVQAEIKHLGVANTMA